MIGRVAVVLLAASWLAGCKTPAYSKARDTAQTMAKRTCTLPVATPDLPTEVWAVKSNTYVVRVSCAMPTSELVNGKVVTRAPTDANWSVFLCQGPSCRKLEGAGDWNLVAASAAKAEPPAAAEPPPAAETTPPAEAPPATQANPAEAELRAALDARSADILACVQADKTLVTVELSGSSLSIALTGDLAGGAEEGCVRSVLADVPVPADAAALKLMHLVRKK